MLQASGVAARLRLGAVPIIHGVLEAALEGFVPGGTKRNLQTFGKTTTFHGAWSDAEKLAVADAQTSGGLLFAIAPERAEALVTALEKRDVENFSRVGEVEEGEPGHIHFVR